METTARMDVERATEPLTGRKVVRRGLIAGLAGLGAAAMMKLNGAGRASAANGDPILIGSAANAGTSFTKLSISQNNDCAFVGINGSNINLGSGRLGLLGVAGLDTGPIAAATGVFGFSFNSGATAIGVEGRANSGTGVRGVSNTSTGFGVRGANGANGTGVKGVSNTGSDDTTDGTGNGIGVHGKSTGGAGVQGESVNAPGVQGVSTNGLGVRAVSTNFVGIVGISSANHGLYGSTSSASSAGFVGENLAGGLAGYFAGNVQITGALMVGGAKNAVIKMQDGTMASVYCQESPEPYFEDFGEGRLAGGVAQVALEPEFATLVAGGKYLVFLTPQGPSQGLYVSRQGPTGFEVRDAGNGSIGFAYRVVTKRKDIEGRRFARVVDSVGPSLAASRAALGVTGAPQNNAPPSVPTPPALVPPPVAPLPNPTQPGPTAPTNETLPNSGPPSITGR
jgi:hypothetical protein